MTPPPLPLLPLLAALAMPPLLPVTLPQRDDVMRRWDLPTCRLTAHTEFVPHSAGVTFGGLDRNPTSLSYVFSMASRGRVLAVTLSDGTCRLLDAQTCKEHVVLDEHARRGSSAFACALSETSTVHPRAGGVKPAGVQEAQIRWASCRKRVSASTFSASTFSASCACAPCPRCSLRSLLPALAAPCARCSLRSEWSTARSSVRGKRERHLRFSYAFVVARACWI